MTYTASPHALIQIRHRIIQADETLQRQRYEAKVAALAQDTIQTPLEEDASPSGSQAEESHGDDLLHARMPKPFFWEKNKRKGEPVSRHPLLSAKNVKRGEKFQFSESVQEGDVDDWMPPSDVEEEARVAQGGLWERKKTKSGKAGKGGRGSDGGRRSRRGARSGQW